MLQQKNTKKLKFFLFFVLSFKSIYRRKRDAKKFHVCVFFFVFFFSTNVKYLQD